MDDKRFDDIVKGKVGEYADPTYDEGAIAGLHQHLAGSLTVPWYQKYNQVLMTSSALLLFTLINWYMINSSQIADEDVNGYNSSVENEDAYGKLIEELKQEIRELSSISPDTIYVVNEASLSAENRTQSSEEIINQFLVSLKGKQKVGNIGGYYFVHEDDLVHTQDLLAMSSKNVQLSQSSPQFTYPNEDSLYKHLSTAESIEEDHGRMPLIVIKDLEKHYSKGIGIMLGAELELAHSAPKPGSGEILPGAGVLTEVVFSPRLGLETGVKYKSRSYEIEDPSSDQLVSFPGVGDLQSVTAIEVDAQLLELPINMKYYSPISQYKDVFFSLGISPNLYLSQSFEYIQETNSNLPAETTLTSKTEIEKPKFYAGTVNFATGLSFDLAKQRSAQVGLFYQRDLGGIGQENQKFNIFGLKSSYWFRVR